MKKEHIDRCVYCASGILLAAWGSAIAPVAPMYDTTFGTALRLVGQDMKVTDYLDTGHFNHQVPPSWWQ